MNPQRNPLEAKKPQVRALQGVPLVGLFSPEMTLFPQGVGRSRPGAIYSWRGRVNGCPSATGMAEEGQPHGKRGEAEKQGERA
jgi:hypothetical protein